MDKQKCPDCGSVGKLITLNSFFKLKNPARNGEVKDGENYN